MQWGFSKIIMHAIDEVNHVMEGNIIENQNFLKDLWGVPKCTFANNFVLEHQYPHLLMLLWLSSCFGYENTHGMMHVMTKQAWLKLVKLVGVMRQLI